MSLPQVTLSPNGLSNAAPWQTMAAAGLPDPTWAHIYSNDFDTYAAGDWTVTQTGATTQALATGYDGGALLITNTTGAADLTYMQLVAAGFKLIAGHDIFFKFAGEMSDVTNSVFHCGLIQKSTTPTAANDGLYIVKATGQAGLVLKSVVGGVTTSVAFPSTLVLANATYFELGIHVDPLGNVEAFFNPTTGNVPAQPNVTGGQPRGAVARLTAPGVTQVALTPSFGLLNSTGAARTLTVDYVVAAKC